MNRSLPRLDPARARIYAPLVIPHLPRLFAALDREPLSPSFGCADRDYWAWKFRDYPISMLNMSTWPLALAWSVPYPDNPYHQDERVALWIGGALEYLAAAQHRNGAFDSVAPYSQDHGTSLALAYTVHETARLLGDALAPDVRERVRDVVARAAAFGFESVEGYSFITNHQALFALGFLAGHEATGEDRFLDRAREVVGSIRAHQHDDGWFAEYDGFDPGYESLALLYLAKLWRALGDDDLLAAMRRSVAFLRHAVHPDHSIGGVYGRRHTRMYCPAGLEKLAAHVPDAAAVATFMRAGFGRGNVVTPERVDAHNLPVMSYAFLEAALVDEDEPAEAPDLPCRTLRGLTVFESGLCVFGGERYYGVAELSRGGVCRIFDRSRGELAYEDAGYVVSTGAKTWATQMWGLGKAPTRLSEGAVRAVSRAASVRSLLPTPMRFMVLRILNLTAFRSARVGRWLMSKIIGRLITDVEPGPIELTREIHLGADSVRLRDRISTDVTLEIERLALVRAFTGIHMGSTRYQLAQDLMPGPEIPLDLGRRTLGSDAPLTVEVEIRFVDTGTRRITIELPPDSPPHAT